MHQIAIRAKLRTRIMVKTWTCVLRLNLLPLLYSVDLCDVIFIKALKQPLTILYDHASFSTVNTKSSSNKKLNHVLNMYKLKDFANTNIKDGTYS